MKVAIVSRYPRQADRPRGGVESVTVVLVGALARLEELDVHVVTLEADLSRPAVETAGRLTVHRLPGSRWPQILDIHVGPGRRRLLRYLRDLGPDVVHVHETYGLAMGDWEIPTVFTVHGFDTENLPADSARFAGLRSRLWRLVERRGLGRQKYVISITPYVRRVIEPLTGARIVDIENPVDERFFAASAEPRPGRLLTVGWISERKNTLGTLDALARVIRLGRQATLAIAGAPKEPDYRRRVEEFISREDLSGRVELLGHVGHEKLIEQLARASVLVLPSRQENSPMAIAEAMAVGLPVISSNRCEMPYMIDEGRTGFLVDPEDTAQIADRICRLLDEPALCRRMGREARQEALRRWHPDQVARRTLQLYREIARDAKN
ncbi:MAG: glycosyltransferase family 4 protein [Planctomycetes bacterium]|nr:glycosyltransferase family 4 protein [Planctomycetota bacterium]